MCQPPSPAYTLDDQGRFVVEAFPWAPPFSNFLPGVAGEWGVPLWLFYVNRGQAVTSFGVADKDGALFEFLSLNTACQTVPRRGFRTFLRVDGAFHEPFRSTPDPALRQRLMVTPHELELEETHPGLGLRLHVLYHTLPGLPLAALVRQATLTNLGDRPLEVEWLDGAARLLPHGVTFEHTRIIARHIEAMMGVAFHRGVPLLRLKQTPADVARVGRLQAAHFVLALAPDGPLPPERLVLDPAALFGHAEDLDEPWPFRRGGLQAVLEAPQVLEGRTPCAFAADRLTLAPSASRTLTTLLGYTPDEATLDRLLPDLARPDFLAAKRRENQEAVDRVRQRAFTLSADPRFDAYIQNTFLDNLLRGGMPVTLEAEGRRTLFHIYGRQNADPERDYHWFVLPPTYLSQGNGHFRNVLQNRRLDPWFFPETVDEVLAQFLNLLQLDGYNPLVVEPPRFRARRPETVRPLLESLAPDLAAHRALLDLVRRPFTPGEFVMALERLAGIPPSEAREPLARLLARCQPDEIGALHEGFWIDHWHYHLDLLEVLQAVYPDRLRALLLERRDYTFYDNPDVVQPRHRKTALVEGRVRQYGAVARDPEKAALIASRSKDPCRVRTRHGRGEVYRTNLLGKLLALFAVKVAALDPSGFGLEMEAGKPGWCDSLNGLPALFGSAVGERHELVRLARWLRRALADPALDPAEPQPLFEELHALLAGLGEAIAARLRDPGPEAALRFWRASHDLLEAYREATRLGVEGRERSMTLAEVDAFLAAALDLLTLPERESPAALLDPESGVPVTYFVHEVTEYRVLEGQRTTEGHPAVEALAFRRRPVAPFLEGPVHLLRVTPERAAEVYRAARASDLYDGPLGMFRCCASLEAEPYELGRIQAYPRGWIEHEGIYTHMTFKWLLELLRSGEHEAFFEELRRHLPPFLDPAVYGRSPLENCSFLASSVYPDAGARGRAFQPRLSGVTVEALHLWAWMAAGPAPFRLGPEGALRLRLEPVLPAWLFTRERARGRWWEAGQGWQEVEVPAGAFAFRFLGRTLVVYRNPERRPTFGEGGARPVRYTFFLREGEPATVEGAEAGAPWAEAVRRGEVPRLEVDLAAG